MGGFLVGESVFVDEGEVFVDEAQRHPGEERELISWELLGEEPYLFEAANVAVDGTFGVERVVSDLWGEEPFEVEANDRCFVGGERSHVSDVAA